MWKHTSARTGEADRPIEGAAPILGRTMLVMAVKERAVYADLRFRGRA